MNFWQMVLAMIIAQVIWDCLKLLFKWKRVQWVSNKNNHYRVIWPAAATSEHSDIPN